MCVEGGFLFKISKRDFTFIREMRVAKGQLISKANCQAKASTKKRTNEFVFTNMQRVFVRFLEEIEDSKKEFQKSDL